MPTTHKIGAVVLILCALVLALQGLFILTLSDDALLAMVKTAAKQEREKQAPNPMMRPLTDKELDERIEQNRNEILTKARETGGGVRVWGMKFLVVALLGVVLFGIFTRNPNPARAVAALVGVLLALGTFYILMHVGETLKEADLVSGPIFLLDISSVVLVPLTMIFCFVVRSQGLWTDATPTTPRKL